MAMRYQEAYDLAEMRPENFAEALRLLLGDAFVRPLATTSGTASS